MHVSYLKKEKIRVFLNSRECVIAQGGMPGTHVKKDAHPSVENAIRVYSSSRNRRIQIPT